MISRGDRGLAMPRRAAACAASLLAMASLVSWSRSAWAQSCEPAAWAQLHPYPRTTPAARVGHGLVYDARRDRLVLFGGVAVVLTNGNVSPDSTQFDDVWEYDVVEERWAGPLQPEERPPARHLHAVAYDPTSGRERVVMHGGTRISGDVVYSDTWEWRGPIDGALGEWVRATPAHEEMLRPRWGHALVFDPSRQKLVLFGGAGWYGTADVPPEMMRAFEYSDVWEYGLDSAGQLAWEERRPNPSDPHPVGRWGHALAAISECQAGGRSCVAVFGGATGGTPLSDLWLWDGIANAWGQIEAEGASGPRARYGHASYFDAVRQRWVLFGGKAADQGAAWWNPSDLLNDTWEIEPKRWSWSENAVFQGQFARPRSRLLGRMAWDEQRARGDLFGGLTRNPSANPYLVLSADVIEQLADTWHHRSPTWVSLEVKPTGRIGSALAVEASSGRLLLFGGDADDGAQGDTWSWDGRSEARHWTEHGLSAQTPGARWDHAMAFDPLRERVVLFGGQDLQGSVLDDPWEWKSVAFEWSPIPASRVPARKAHAMAWDPVAQSILLFGGRDGGDVFADTWRWDGGARRWRSVAASDLGPPARIRSALASDIERGRVVMFGGMGAAGDLLDDTWEWDGGQERWQAMAPPGERPSPRRGHSMTFDAGRGSVVLFGGFAAAIAGDVWEWNGARAIWIPVPTSGGPSVVDGAMAFDPSSGRSVLFGGYSGERREDTTWALASPANARPVLEPIGPRAVHAGETLAFHARAQDPDALMFSMLDAPEGVELDASTGHFRWTPREDQAGVHAVTLSASDDCAADSERVEITVCRGNCPPVLDEFVPQAVRVGVLFELPIVAVDPEGDPLGFSSSPLPSGARLDPGSGLFEWEATTADVGMHTIRFVVSDGQATDEATGRFTVCDGNCSPELDPIGDRTVPVGTLLGFTVTAVDLDGDALAFDAPERPAGAAFDARQQRFRWTPDRSRVGSHMVTFRVTDGLLWDEETIRIFVCDGNCPPTAEPIEDHTVPEGEALAFTVVAHDHEGDAVSHRAEGLPPEARFEADTGAFSWTPTYDQGGSDYTIVFWASDAHGETSQTALVRVLDVNRPPIVGALDPLRAVVGEELAAPISAADPDGYPIAVASHGILPAGARFEEARFVWVPATDQIGTHTISFVVEELGGDHLSVEGRLEVEVVSAGGSDASRPAHDADGCGCAAPAGGAGLLGGAALARATRRRNRNGGLGP